MRKVIDLSGKTFGQLLVISFSHLKSGGSYWNCVCDCGRNKVIRRDALIQGKSKSCGCKSFEQLRRRTHHNHAGSSRGQSVRSPEYHSWAKMKARCLNKNDANYKWYGAKGVLVCDRWMTFENFLEDMKQRPPGKSLDRINPYGNYEPCNCRWATTKEQASNKRLSYRKEIYPVNLNKA